MELEKQIDNIIELEFQIDKLYEKVYEAEMKNEIEKVKENLSYIRFLKEIEEEKIQKLRIDKDRFYEIIHRINVDDYLKLIYSIENGRIYYKINMDNILTNYFFVYRNGVVCNSDIHPSLGGILEGTVNHPVMRRFFYKIMENYYKNIENPPLQFDNMIATILYDLLSKGEAKKEIFLRENAIALLYLDIYTQFDMQFLEEGHKEEYQKDKDLREFMVTMKNYMCESNPRLEEFLLEKDKYYINPRNRKIEEKYGRVEKRFYKNIRETISILDIENIMVYLKMFEIEKGKEHDAFYKLYIKSRLAHLKDAIIEQLYTLSFLNTLGDKDAAVVPETISEEKQKRIEKKIKARIHKT